VLLSAGQWTGGRWECQTGLQTGQSGWASSFQQVGPGFGWGTPGDVTVQVLGATGGYGLMLLCEVYTTVERLVAGVKHMLQCQGVVS
jgi:hypothetical protein